MIRVEYGANRLPGVRWFDEDKHTWEIHNGILTIRDTNGTRVAAFSAPFGVMSGIEPPS